MAIVSSGYDTELYTEAEWAQVHGQMLPYQALKGGSCKVTALSGAGLTCQVAAGTVYGWGVVDTVTTPTNVTFSAAPSSGTRYDLVAMRRDWSGTGGGPSTLVVIPGSTTRAVPTRNRTPGTLDDQPLALVPISAASASPGTPIDLRTHGVGVVTCYDPMAVHANDWPVGTEVKVGTGKNAARYEVQVATATTNLLRQVPRPPVTSPAPVALATNAQGVGVVTHNLGWRPARMDFGIQVPAGYGNLIKIDLSWSANLITTTTATVVVTAHSGAAGDPRPYSGNIAQVTWTAHEGIA